jgi:hypothetical protein
VDEHVTRLEAIYSAVTPAATNNAVLEAARFQQG